MLKEIKNKIIWKEEKLAPKRRESGEVQGRDRQRTVRVCGGWESQVALRGGKEI